MGIGGGGGGGRREEGIGKREEGRGGFGNRVDVEVEVEVDMDVDMNVDVDVSNGCMGVWVYGNMVVWVYGCGMGLKWRKVDVAQEDPDRRQRLAGGVSGNQTKSIEFVDRCSTIQYLTAYVCCMGHERPHLELSGRRS